MADQPIHKARAELSRLTALIDALTIGVFMVDTDGMVTEFNHHLANILHVGEDEFVGKPYQELFARLLEDSAEPEVVQSSLADAVIAVAERPVVDVVLASEPVRHLETSFFPVWEDDGAPIGWGGLLSDVTDERERVAWKLELLSILSHDIRAPLATLKGHATAVLSNFRMWDDAMVMEFLQTISRSTDQVIKQVDRNLALTRVESGRLGLRPEACSPETLIEQAVERAAAVMDDKEVRVSVPPDTPQVRADPGRVEELLINLLENAARYSPEDKPIEINADSEQRRVRFSVLDRGPGVPADRQKEIFRKHVHGGDADQTGGLGLYISRRIAEAHGGKLWVESPLENSDHGSRFVFALPEMPHIASRASASTDQELRSAVQAEQAPLQVLIIEDEVDFQALIRSMLLEAGFEVEMARDGSTAIDIVQTSPPDLITLDWMLPRMDGLQVCRGIRRWSKAPILMITSKTGQSDLVAAFDAGVDDYLTKPFEAAEFIARLNALARRREGTPAKDSDHVSIDGLTIDYDSQQVWLAGQHIELTPTEYNLLAYLARHRAQVLTYQQLLEHLYGTEVKRSRHDLFVHISRLRKKIETDPEDPTFIETRWGVGYVFSPG